MNCRDLASFSSLDQENGLLFDLETKRLCFKINDSSTEQQQGKEFAISNEKNGAPLFDFKQHELAATCALFCVHHHSWTNCVQATCPCQNQTQIDHCFMDPH